jgi:predicted CXXCH cytochrome family protein
MAPRTDRLRALVRAAGVLATLALGGLAAPAAAQGIANTKHDFSTNSAAPVRAETETKICVFCHTPHRATSVQPLWNRQLSVQSYTWGTDIGGDPITETMAGTPLPSNVNLPSKRCLCCHDGTIAIGLVNNTGNGNPGTIPMQDDLGRLKADGSILYAVAQGGSLGGHHPVSIPYAGETYHGVTSAVPASKVNNAQGGYWRILRSSTCSNNTGLCTEATGLGQGTQVKLHAEVKGGTTNIGIECDSCHEPHGKYGWPALMRADAHETDSLCMSCHNK